MAELTDLAGTLGADRVSAAQPYVPAAVAAFARHWVPAAEPVSAPSAQPWPGPVLPGEPIADVYGTRCVMVTGAAAVWLRRRRGEREHADAVDIGRRSLGGYVAAGTAR